MREKGVTDFGNAILPAPPVFSECLPFFLWYWSIKLEVPQKLHVLLLCLAAEAQAQHIHLGSC